MIEFSLGADKYTVRFSAVVIPSSAGLAEKEKAGKRRRKSGGIPATV
jgi:hypothetical protein